MTAIDPFYPPVPGEIPFLCSGHVAGPQRPGDLLEESPVFDCFGHSGTLLILCPEHHQEKAEEEEVLERLGRGNSSGRSAPFPKNEWQLVSSN